MGDESSTDPLAPVDVAEVGRAVYRIDLHERGRPQRNACYVVDGGGTVALVEVGSGPSVGALLGGLRALGVAEERVRWLVVTHVHLDHAGAAGALARRWPWVRVAVHPDGARHLIDPARLEASARHVYGARFDALFGPLVPVPADRVWAAPDGQSIALGERQLIVIHTPGHAHHHMALADPASGGVFTGDGAGIVYPSLRPWGLSQFHLPNTTPPRFDPEAMLASLDRVAARLPDRLYVTHFGTAAPADRFLDECAQGVREWWALATAAATLEGVRASLRQWIEEALRAQGVRARDIEAAWRAADLESDLDLNSQGLWAYAERRRAASV